MKSIFKLLTVALAVGSLASCTDDLNLQEQRVAHENELIATLPDLEEDVQTRVGVVSAVGKGNYVWAADDEVNIYGLNSLDYETYKIVDGEEGNKTAAFEKTKSATLTGKKYAVTQPKESDVIYGVSSRDGKPLLTAKIPAAFDWSTLTTADGETAYVVESPFWGDAEISGQGFNVEFQALTSFLKVDMEMIPENTKALVLTTHEDFSIGNMVYTGGANEALSGTMNAILDPENSVGLQADEDNLVTNDTIRVNLDIAVGGEAKILYIPVPAGNYKKLYLLAVTDDNKLPYNYNAAEIVREWDDKDFTRGKAVSISITDLKDLTWISSPMQLSQEIASIVAESGNHTVRVLASPVSTDGDNTIYLATNFEGQTSVEITFVYGAEVSAAPAPSTPTSTSVISGTITDPSQLARITRASSVHENWGDLGLNIVECPVGTNYFSSGFLKPQAATALSQSGAKERTVRLNFTGAKYDKPLNIYLPTSDVVLNNQSTDGYAPAAAATSAGGAATPNTLGKFDGAIQIVASTTNHVSAYDYTEINNKEAGIIIKGGNQYKQIDVLAGNQGAVYVYGDDTEVLTLNIASPEPAGIRITDGLVGLLEYKGGILSNNQGVFTTGAAAIKQVKGINGTGYIYPFWTGKALSDYAVYKGYEGKDVKDPDWGISSGAIYTAAQLQAAGLDASLQKAGSGWTSGSPVLTYKITKKVSKIQLGGTRYPWLGGQIGKLNPDFGTSSDRSLYTYDFLGAQLSDAVTIDGNNVELTNMMMSYNDPYIQDPHKCCTSCGDYFVKVDQDLGLFRNILTSAAVTVNNIYLNNVTLVAPDQYIPNVGSIAGRIESAALNMDNNITTNIEIFVKGNDVGGQVGDIYATGDIAITNSLVGTGYTETRVPKNFVKTTGNNAGGVVGNLNGQATVKILYANVGLAEVSAFEGSNAGGIAGEFEFKTGGGTAEFGDKLFTTISGFTTQVEGEVAVNLLQATESSKSATSQAGYGKSGSNVGGFIGNLWAVSTQDRVAWTLEKSQKIEMWGKFNSADAVLAEGRNAGGLVGYSYLAETANNDHTSVLAISSDVTAQRPTTITLNNLEATNGNAGGLIGWNYKGDAVIGGGGQYWSGGGKEGVNASEVKIANIALLSAASGAAGLVGVNGDAVDVSGLHRTYWNTKKFATPVSVTVADFANTWTESQFNGGYAYGDNSALSKKLGGTFAGILGQGNNEFFIRNANVTVSPELISDSKKYDLLFYVNPDGINTHAVENDVYWGDHNGYVGYMTNTGSYYINGAIPQGDQNFNYRTNYTATEAGVGE
jgi:hypothetical protein